MNTITFPRLGIQIDRPGKTLLTIVLVCSVFFTAWSCDQVISDLDVVIETANAIGAAVGVVSPSDAAIIQGLSSTALLGLNAVKTAYDTYKASGAVTDEQKLMAAIQAIQTNLPAELAAAHITSATATRIVTAWVNLVVTALTAILNALPQLTSSTVSTRKKVKLAASLPTKSSIRAQWANDVCQNDAPCVALVK
jgi:hypothetical protein